MLSQRQVFAQLFAARPHTFPASARVQWAVATIMPLLLTPRECARALSQLCSIISLSLSYINACTASRMQIPFITLVSTHAQWICVLGSVVRGGQREFAGVCKLHQIHAHTPLGNPDRKLTPHSAKVLLIKLQFICGYHKKNANLLDRFAFRKL